MHDFLADGAPSTIIQPSSEQLKRALTDVDGMVSCLSAALHGINEFDQFLGGLNRTFELVSSLTGREFHFEFPESSPDSASEPFSTPELTAPVDVGGHSSGYVQVSPPGSKRPFGPEDLIAHAVGHLRPEERSSWLPDS